MENDLSDCLLLNTVMAARAMTRRYDRQLKPFGVSVVQFSVLTVLDAHGGETVSRMAARIAMDRTTLIRNLELLARKGLVEAEPAPKGNGRLFSLTSRGKLLLAELVPKWRVGQAEVRSLLGENDAGMALAVLRRLAAG